MAQFFTNSMKRSVSQGKGGKIILHIYIISYSFSKLSVPVSINKHRATHSFKRKLKGKGNRLLFIKRPEIKSKSLNNPTYQKKPPYIWTHIRWNATPSQLSQLVYIERKKREQGYIHVFHQQN